MKPNLTTRGHWREGAKEPPSQGPITTSDGCPNPKPRPRTLGRWREEGAETVRYIEDYRRPRTTYGGLTKTFKWLREYSTA
jgi:hypothetical protein